MNQENLETFLSKFPIYQYAFLKTEDLDYSEKVRLMCKRTCTHYAASWSCPPAVGKLNKCREHCLRYSDVLLFSTVTELSDPASAEKKAAAQTEHERLTTLINNHMRDQGYLTYVISSSYCKLCPKCTFPRDYCRHPDEMFPCIESHGILIPDLCAACEMDYYMGERLCLLFSMIFFKDSGFILAPEEQRTDIHG